MDIGEVLIKSWKIVWKFKVLWIFGIFAGCARGGGSSGGSGYRTGGVSPSGSVQQLPPGFESTVQKGIAFFSNPIVIAAFISLVLVIILLSIFFSVMGRIGLIKGALDADGDAERLSFGELWKTGLHYFWRILGLSLLIGSPILLFYLVIGIGGVIGFLIYISGPQNGSFLAYAPALLVLIPVFCALICAALILGVSISFLKPQAERAIVIENEGVISGLKRGWRVLKENLGAIIFIWLITVIITFVAAFVIALPLLIVLIPAILAFVFGQGNQTYLPLIIAGLCIAAYIPVSLIANGILTAYLETLWTLTYLRLTTPKGDAQPAAILPANA